MPFVSNTTLQFPYEFTITLGTDRSDGATGDTLTVTQVGGWRTDGGSPHVFDLSTDLGIDLSDTSPQTFTLGVEDGLLGDGIIYDFVLYTDNAGSDYYSQITWENVNMTPEPMTLILLGTGLAGLVGIRKKSKARSQT